MDNKQKSDKPTAWQVLISVLGGLFGVQSSRVQERDFTAGHPWWIYVFVGGVVTVLCVLLLVSLAKFIVLKASVG
jgi:hypothetical protein